MSSVFVSYSSINVDEVAWIGELLEKLNIDYWKAPEMIPAGSNYAREIPQAIQECQVFLLIVTKESQESIWVEKELDSAVCNRKQIVPIWMDDEPLNEMFTFYLNNVQMIVCQKDWREGAKKIRERLLQLLSEKEVKTTKVELPKQAEQEEKDGEAKSVREMKMVVDFEQLGTENYNLIPAECRYCGSEVKKVGHGVFQCVRCGKESYDYFRIVKNYLETHGPSTYVEIEKATHVPRRAINSFFKEDRLEVTKRVIPLGRCKRCGTPISVGILCENCQRKGDGAQGTGTRADWYFKR